MAESYLCLLNGRIKEIILDPFLFDLLVMVMVIPQHSLVGAYFPLFLIATLWAFRLISGCVSPPVTPVNFNDWDL